MPYVAATVKELSERLDAAVQAVVTLSQIGVTPDQSNFSYAIRVELAEREYCAAQRAFNAAVKKLSDDELRALL